VLLVLDNLETLLEEGESRGRLRSGYEGYGKLLRRVGETTHQGCLLLTSREKLTDLEPQEGSRRPVRTLRLDGLETAASEQLLAEKEVVGLAHDRARLVEVYAGNPLALNIVAQTIVELFGGEIAPFLTNNAFVLHLQGKSSQVLRAQLACDLGILSQDLDEVAVLSPGSPCRPGNETPGAVMIQSAHCQGLGHPPGRDKVKFTEVVERHPDIVQIRREAAHNLREEVLVFVRIMELWLKCKRISMGRLSIWGCAHPFHASRHELVVGLEHFIHRVPGLTSFLACEVNAAGAGNNY